MPYIGTYALYLHMRKNGQIIIIDDDADDREILHEVISSLELPNPIVLLSDSTTAKSYLEQNDVNPFVILCDINMPKLNGFQLRDSILEDVTLTEKCTPWIFFTTAGSKETIQAAYAKSAQGFFHKINDYNKFQSTMRRIVDYWSDSVTAVD